MSGIPIQQKQTRKCVHAHIMDQGTVNVKKHLPYVAGTLDTGLFVQNKTKTNKKTVFPDTSKVLGYEILY